MYYLVEHMRFQLHWTQCRCRAIIHWPLIRVCMHLRICKSTYPTCTCTCTHMLMHVLLIRNACIHAHMDMHIFLHVTSSCSLLLVVIWCHFLLGPVAGNTSSASGNGLQQAMAGDQNFFSVLLADRFGNAVVAGNNLMLSIHLCMLLLDIVWSEYLICDIHTNFLLAECLSLWYNKSN